MTKKQIEEMILLLKKAYPDAKCSLDFCTPFQLAIAVMLSAQCTDARVNQTTPKLFSKYKNPKDFITAPTSKIEQIIRPCGFYKNKSKNIKEMATIVENKFNGLLPNNMEDLMSLPGIGRKSANVIMVDAFNNPQGIAVDTHVKRISNRIGLSQKTDPEKIEIDLLNIIPKKYFGAVNHLFIWHGRQTCTAQSPNCENCPIKNYCNYKKMRWLNHLIFLYNFSSNYLIFSISFYYIKTYIYCVFIVTWFFRNLCLNYSNLLTFCWFFYASYFF